MIRTVFTPLLILLVLHFISFPASAGKNDASTADVRQFLNEVSAVRKSAGKQASKLFTKDFVWWNIHYEWDLVEKKAYLKWSNVSRVTPDNELLSNIFGYTKMDAAVETIKIIPTVDTFKDSCEIPDKWRRKWLVWRGNYQQDELKKIGKTFHIHMGDDGKKIEKVIPAEITLVYFNNKGQNIFVGLIREKGRLLINYAGFRQECDT